MSDAEFWDNRYSTAEFVWKTEPNQFLPLEVGDLVAGRALDIACGEGRNAVWLATQGWEVTGVDFSATGLAKAERLAEANGVTVEWAKADVAAWTPEPTFDLVVVLYLHLPEVERRAAFVRAARALTHGGTLFIIGHDVSNLTDGVGGPQDASILYSPADVCDDLYSANIGGLEIERSECVYRNVGSEPGGAQAIDCLVRARRASR